MDVSVIIPTSNRADLLKETLKSLALQNISLHVRWEVIVIDNGSIDNTKKVCDLYEKKFPGFIYCYDAEPGLLTGRHKGYELAKGDILSFIDDDVILASEWLQGIANAFSSHPEDVHFVTGPCLPQYETEPPAWLVDFWKPSPYGGMMCGWLSLLNLENKEQFIRPFHVWGLNFSIRRKSFYELGGFHPDCIPSHLQQFQGDGETGMAYKAEKLGYKALYSPVVKLYHVIPSDRLMIDYFEKRAFYQGVCNSYTEIRKDAGLYGKADEKLIQVKKENSFFSFLSFGLKHGKSKIMIPSQNTVSYPEINQRMDENFRKGYLFHRQAFNNDKAVYEWVLKKNYWDYKLPL